jgi:hypothetical protein
VAGDVDPRFVPELKQVFAEYKKWGRVDDELRWAPDLCRMPMPAKPHASRAAEGEHAKKLYSLFARDHLAYVMFEAKREASPGQIVVKESYRPELVASPTTAERNPFWNRANEPQFDPTPDHFRPYAHGADGKLYRAAEVLGLYVVLQKPKDTPGTDDGFVYATLTSKGEITAAGRVASCMGCHVEATHGRFFGSAAVAY